MSEKWEKHLKIEGRYEIHDIKRGGMGIVFLCYDHKERMPVAIKTFQDKYLMDKDSVDRFVHEASTWVDLGRHKSIVRACHVGNINYRPYIFLEYIVGDDYYGADLSGWIANKGLDSKTILNFAIQFCNGMIHAKSKFREMDRPFVHRDIKPSNIMVTKDRVVKVTDFGLVKTLGETDLSKGWGTSEYMSPEQFQESNTIDISSDIYSFGCVLFEMICGVPPFKVPDTVYPGARRYFYQKKHSEELPPEPKVIREDCPRSLNILILKCLEKVPSRRYQDFETLRDDLLELYFHLTGGIIKEESLLGEILVNLPDEQELNSKGLSLDNLGRYHEAIECFNQALEIDKEQRFTYSLYCNRGRTYEHMKQLDRAIDDYNKAIKIDKTNTLAYISRANVHSNLGQRDKALKGYSKAIELDQNDRIAFYNRGLYYVRSNMLNEALEDFNRAIELGFTAAYTNRGAVYSALSQVDEAIRDYIRAIELNPRDVIAYTNLATFYTNIGEFDRAMAEYTKAIQINPFYPVAYYNRGNLYLQLGQLEKAVDDYNKVINIDPTDTDRIFTTIYAVSEIDMEEIYLGTYYNCGIAYAKLGKSKEAIACFKKFLNIAPSQYNKEIIQVRKIVWEIEEVIR